ncbi:MAG TPA: Fe-S-containing hydro-lyase [Eubacteriaceae bacterium]|nr:Fe-S-containing hydro-lyase [Eubacteriaceae bacterium]
MRKVNIQWPKDREKLLQLEAGDQVLISGTIYTARDAAHKRMVEDLEEGKSMPIPIQNQIIYYAGPCPAKPGEVIGSVGPTTSGRMDRYAPKLLDLGLSAMIGKGDRDRQVIDSMKKNGAVYLAAVGGAGALLQACVKSAKVVGYDELGTEAIRELLVEEFPATVVIDAQGNNLYQREKEKYKTI